MTSGGLGELFAETLRRESNVEAFERLAAMVVEEHEQRPRFRIHVANRISDIDARTGGSFAGEKFNLAAAQAMIANEIGFESWEELIDVIEERRSEPYPMLFRYAVAALRRGDFTALDDVLGGREGFEASIAEWLENGYFANEQETLDEAFTAACMVGHERVAAYLLDRGVDPNAGMRTGLNGFHYAASNGRPQIIKLLVDRGVDPEITNAYGGTVLGQALWSAVNEHSADHAEIVELLVCSGAHVQPGTLEWWSEQPVPWPETKTRVTAVLQEHHDFHKKHARVRRES
jgi:hypothetical protein